MARPRVVWCGPEAGSLGSPRKGSGCRRSRAGADAGPSGRAAATSCFLLGLQAPQEAREEVRSPSGFWERACGLNYPEGPSHILHWKGCFGTIGKSQNVAVQAPLAGLARRERSCLEWGWVIPPAKRTGPGKDFSWGCRRRQNPHAQLTADKQGGLGQAPGK